MLRVVSFVLVAAVALVARDAHACSIASPSPFELDPSKQGVDTTPPVLSAAAIDAIGRGHGTAFGCGASSCDDIAFLSVSLTATDDGGPVGFRITAPDGAAPNGLFPLGQTVSMAGSSLELSWVDGAVSVQEPLDFTLSIVAVDAAGNESAPMEVRVVHPGSVGCSSVPPAALASLVALALRRRRTPR